MNITSLSNPNPVVKNWYSSTNFGTPDYMHTCATFYAPTAFAWTSAVPKSRYGYQNPKTGDAYAGMGTYVIHDPSDSTTNDVEYFSIKLANKLKINSCYYGEFYASLADFCEISINQLSMLITTNTFTTASYNFTNTIQPQIQWDTTKYFTDTLNWVKISGKFIAQGGEQYLTIGNFKDGIYTKKTNISSNFISPEISPGTRKFSFVFIDDVTVYEIPKPQLGADFEYCQEEDSMQIGDSTLFGNEFKWYVNGVLIDTLHKQITIKPTVNTTYILQNGGCAADTLVVTFKSCPVPLIIEVVEPIIPNIFTPNNDSINDVWHFSLGKGNSLKSLIIYNRWGNEIAVSSRASVTQINWDGYTTSGEPVSSGVYFYVLQYTDANGNEHKKNGYITLIK
jgi:gliding motility-associated-like protein